MIAIEKTNNTGKLLVAVLAMFMIVAGCAVVFSDSINAADENAPATGDSLDDLISNADENGTVTLDAKEYTLTSTITKPVTINGVDGSVIKISSKVEIQANVTFNNVKFADSSSDETAKVLLNPYVGYNAPSDVIINFDKVTFDESFIGDTIYLSPMSPTAKLTVNINDSDCTNATFVYMANGAGAVLNFNNSNNANLNISAGSNDSAVEYGTDIIAGNSTMNNVWISNEQDVTTYTPPTFTIPAGEELSATNDIKVEGTMNIDGTVESKTMTVTENGNVDLMGTLKADVTAPKGTFMYNGDATFEGKLNNEEINTTWQTLPLVDGTVIDASSSIVASPSQKVTVDGTVTVVKGVVITISGQLVINEGATLTLQEGATVVIDGLGTVIVDGDLVIDGAVEGAENATFTFGGMEMTVNGYVSLDGAKSFTSTGKVTVNGTFEINDEASATLDDAVVAAGGEILVYGDVITSTGKNITNNGTITVDSEKLPSGFSVLMGDAGVLDVVNAYGTITVTDADKNGLILENVSGAYITDSVVKDKDDKDVSTLYLSGTMTYAVDAQSTNDKAKITVSGEKVEIAENVILGTGVTLSVEGALTVSAEMTAVDGTIIGSAAGELTVTGKVITKTDITGIKTINASKYDDKTTGNKVYTTLVTALSEGATSIDVLGKNTVSTDITVPVGTTVTMTEGSTLIISDEATMTVAADERNSGRFDTSKAAADAVEVDGTLVLENSAKSRAADKTKILSDTYKEVGASVTFTNIYNAVENAASGETVTVSRGTPEGIVLDKDLVIGQGVTLAIPSDEKVTVDNGVTVTVDGTIVSEGDYTIEGAVKASEGVKAEPAGATIVNGVFKYNDANKTATYSTQIIGAYFSYDGTNAIMPLESVPAIVNDIEGNTVTLYGQMTVGDIDLSAYDGKDLTLVAKNDFTFGNITLGDVKFESPENKIEQSDKQVNVTSVTGAIVLANGTVTLDNVHGITAQNTTDSEDVTTSYVGGTVYAYNDPVTEKTFETGSVSIDGTVTSNAKFNGKSDTNGGVSVTVVEGATLKVASNGADDITVEGTMVIAGAGVTFTNIVITGTVTVTDGIADATVSGTLYVGVSVEIVGEKKVITDLGVDAAVDGLTLSGEKAIAYVAPGATVGDSFEGLKSTSYYKDDALYVTAYVSDEAKDVNVSDITISIENAVFGGWLKEDGAPVDVTSEVGAPGMEKVYADIITEIYNVQITADGGIGTVAIDGVVLKKSGNTFTTNGLLAAGTYEIDYMLNSGFNGDNVKITVNGQEITGNTITLSGTPAAGETSMVISISIYGTEPVSGSEQIVVNTGSDDMSLTDILLIVLVVLIVIMAVIVALRLMRS